MRSPTASMLADGSPLALLGAALPPLTPAPGRAADPPSLGEGAGVPEGVGARELVESESMPSGRESERERFCCSLPSALSAGEGRAGGVAPPSSTDLRPRPTSFGGESGGVSAPGRSTELWPGAGEAERESGLNEGSAKGARICILASEITSLLGGSVRKAPVEGMTGPTECGVWRKRPSARGAFEARRTRERVG